MTYRPGRRTLRSPGGFAGAVAVGILVVVSGCTAAVAPQTGPTGGVSKPTGSAAGTQQATPGASSSPAPREGRPFVVAPVAGFDEPWAMTFLPDGSALVTERGGALLLVDPGSGAKRAVDGVPEVSVGGQGGLGDVVLTAGYATDHRIYLSWVEAGDNGTSGAVVGRATLHTDGAPRLDGLTVLWRQVPKVTGQGHFGHRLALSPDGRYLFVSSGDRQKMQPAQDKTVNLGKILRLTPDGVAAEGNPFTGQGGVSEQIWSYGHRNPLGLAFDATGNLWSSEMGPLGGDELNLILPGRNYGWPLVSNGSHYSGEDIPDHRAGDGFEAPLVWWNPSISPGSLMIYSGALFPQWRGDAFIGALSGQALIRVALDGTTATKADQWDLGARIREVEQGPDGAIWLLEDGPRGRLLRLTPA